jgi:hypothetical protein
MESMIGAGLGLAISAFAQLVGFDRSRNFYPLALIVIASYYGLFAAMAGARSAYMLEALIFGVFASLAIVGFRACLWVVVIGLLAHGAMDFVHGFLVTNPGVPRWWPGFCASIDIAMGLYAAVRLLRCTRSKELLLGNDGG